MIAIKARYAGRSVSGRPFKKGDSILWNPKTKQVWLASEGTSDTITIGGRDYFRNKAGRCIDAPCCGCCTI